MSPCTINIEKIFMLLNMHLYISEKQKKKKKIQIK